MHQHGSDSTQAESGMDAAVIRAKVQELAPSNSVVTVEIKVATDI